MHDFPIAASVYPCPTARVGVSTLPLPSPPLLCDGSASLSSLSPSLADPSVPKRIFMCLSVCHASGEHRAFFEAQQRREAEERQLREVEETQPMPTTIEGFKRHPQYMLDRHLGTISQIDKLGHLSMIMIYSHTFSHLSIPCPALTPPPPQAAGRWCTRARWPGCSRARPCTTDSTCTRAPP